MIAGTDGSGAVSGINAYDEYGVPAPGNSGLFQYTGQVRIPGTGLYHYKARAYHPGLGRFLQPDPMGYADGVNLYAYVGNDPINLVDPLGLQAAMLSPIEVTAQRYGDPVTLDLLIDNGMDLRPGVERRESGLEQSLQQSGMLDEIVVVSNSRGRGYNIDLLIHEAAGGHTIKMHVAKSLGFLRGRLDSGGIDQSSSFISLRLS